MLVLDAKVEFARDFVSLGVKNEIALRFTALHAADLLDAEPVLFPLLVLFKELLVIFDQLLQLLGIREDHAVVELYVWVCFKYFILFELQGHLLGDGQLFAHELLVFDVYLLLQLLSECVLDEFEMPIDHVLDVGDPVQQDLLELFRFMLCYLVDV